MGMKNSRWLSLLVLCTGFLLIVVDMTIVNVALPSIQRDLGFTQSGLAWVINAYLIAFGGLLLLAGRLGDLFGRKRVFLIGLGIFTAASVLCGLSFNQPMLIAARFIQGIGGAVSSAVILAMARSPILPLRIFASRKISAANVVQALMSSAFLGFFFVASLDLQRVLGYGPMAIGLAFLPVAVVMGLFSIRFSAQLINRFGPFAVLVAGQVVIVAALAVLGFGPTYANYAIHLIVPLALLGLGGGLSFPSMTIIAMSDAQPSDAGLASGLLNTTGQVGGALGLAVLATLAGARTLSLLHDGAGTAAALAGGYHLAWLVGAGTVIVTLALTISLLRAGTATEMAVDLFEGEAVA